MARQPKYNAIVASAEIIRDVKLMEKKSQTFVADNTEVWKYYDTMGELSFGVTWFANTLSRIRFAAARKTRGGEEPEIVTDGPASELVESIADGPGGQSRLLWGFGNFLPMTGDMFLVGETNDNLTSWRVYPPEAIRARGRRDTAVTEVEVDETNWRALPPESIITRVWREHPRRWWRAQSPARVALPIMNELELINRHIVASLQSRLASAGILVVPTEVTFAPNPQFADAPDPFVAELIEAMTTAIKDPGSAAGVVPMVIRVPSAYAEAFKHITFATDIDRKILNMRESAIVRLATTLDLPAEVLTGLGGTNHWNAWAITEEAFKTHVAPAIELVCDAITLGFLRPALEALGVADANEFIVWYDNSEVTIQPDHSENVVAAYDRGEASGRALRREIGIDESDKPTDAELKEQALKSMLKHPTAAPLAARELGILTDIVVPKSSNGTGEDVGGRPSDDTADAAPVRGMPTTPPKNGAG